MQEHPQIPRRSRRAASRWLLSIGCLVGAMAIGWSSEAGEERLKAEGLEQPVEIRTDRWGIAHIHAQTEHDLFFAQGWNVARDRLFQLELWRRQATGTMAEIQGEHALKRDIGARLLRFRGDMNRELAWYHPRGASIVNAFVEGINAYIALTEQEPERLPLSFEVLGFTPGRWTPEVVVSRHNGLFRNASQEVSNARLVHALGSEETRNLLNLQPGRPVLEPDEALDLSLISSEVLELYAASRASVRFRPEDVRPEYRGMNEQEPDDENALTDIFSILENDPGQFGSNNWVVAGHRTLSGRPIMANDPHRALQVPSLRYWVHLVGPGWDVIGGGEPALPGVSIGHNHHGAWGLTIFPIDQEDVYVYETHPDHPSWYRYGVGWEEMRVETETFAVKGQEDVTVPLKFTRHGPVLYEDPENQKAYALRAAWLEVGTAPYLASLRMDQATTWEEFRSACQAAMIPSLNMVWADVHGRIGWQVAGIAPQRRGWDGLLPVPGDGRYEWDSYLPITELPHRVDPPEGWLASANHNNKPPGYPHRVAFTWADPFRYARVAEVLNSGRLLALGEMARLQQDELSIPARLLVPLLRGWEPEDERTRQALERLSTWDFVLDRDSVAAAIYARWESKLKEAVQERFVPEEARSLLRSRSLSTEKLIQWLTTPDGRFGADPLAERDQVLRGALENALEDLEERLGPDQEAWRYGQEGLKHSRLRHALSAAVNDETRAQLNLGPLPRGGSGTTVNNTSDSDNQGSGATFRMVAVVGDWDRSLGTNSPGQSGDPSSPHYSDLFPLWANGQAFPVLSSPEAIEAVTESVTWLQPDRE